MDKNYRLKSISIVAAIIVVQALLVMMLGLLSSAFGSVVSYTIQPSNQDSYIDNGSINGNFDGPTLEVVSNNKPKRALVEFDLSTIPTGVLIETATVQLYLITPPANNRTNDIYRVTNSWLEAQTTWRSRTSALNWTTAGGDFAAGQTSSAFSGTSAGWVAFDVASDVQDFIDGVQTNYGWLVKDSVEANADPATQVYAASENSSSAIQPKLVLSYVKGTTTVTPSTSYDSFSENFSVVMTNTGGANGDDVSQVSFDIPVNYSNIPTTAGGYSLTVSGGKNWTVTPPGGSSGSQTIIVTADTASDDLADGESIQIDFAATTPASAGATNWTSGITGAAGGTFNPATQTVDIVINPAPDTSISDPSDGNTLTVSPKLITGIATDDAAVSTVTIAISRDIDGLYWNESTWTAGPVWIDATITSGKDTTSANWQYSWSLPSDNGGSYTIQARAVDNVTAVDPTPASVSVDIDNIAPAPVSFDIDSGATYSTTTSVTLNIAATGSTEMRFAETTAALSSASWEVYSTSTGFILSSSEGTKTVFSQHKDSAGNTSTIGIAASFDDIFLDTTIPQVISTFPADGATEIGILAIITATLSENDAIDTTTINGASFFLKDSADNTVSASISYDPETLIASLTPASQLSVDSTYTARMTTVVTDFAGNALSTDTVWSFKTVLVYELDTSISDPSDGNTLTVSPKLITGIATDDAAVSTVTIAISRDIDGLYWNESTWTAGPVWIDATITSGKDTTSANWQYSWSLPSDNGGGYIVQARTIDNLGNPDLTPASVSIDIDNVAPVPNSFNIDGGTSYTTTTSVTLNIDVTGSTEMRFAESTASLPSASWEAYSPSTGFIISSTEGTKTVFSQYKDTAGNTSTIGIAASFDDIFLDTTIPQVISTFPADGATEIGILAIITATLSENDAIDTTTINGASFFLKDSADNTVSASISFDPGTLIASLDPDSPLSFESTYTASMTSAVADLAGNSLSTDTVWSFSTVSAASHPPGTSADVLVTSEDMNNRIEWTAVSPASDPGADFDPGAGDGGYNIYRSTSPGGPWGAPINGALVQTTTYDDFAFGPRGIYYYMVRAEDLGGSESGDSASSDNRTVSITKDTSTSGTVFYRSANDLITLEVPSQSSVISLSIQTATETIGGINPITDVYYITPNGTTLTTSATLTFKTPGVPTDATILFNEGADWELVSGGSYTYDVPNKTVSYDNITHFSYYAVTKPADVTPPSAPGTMTLSSPAAGQVKVDWLAATDDESGISGYIVWRADETFNDGNKNPIARIVGTPGDVLTFVDTTVQSGEIYFYGVTAENGAGLKGLLSNVDFITVIGKTPPHWNYSSNSSLCPFCHSVHRSPAQKKIFRKSPEIENCYVCHDGTGSDYDIRTKWEGLSAHDTSMTASPDTNIKCVRCHNPHGVDIGIMMTRDVEENLCFRCHNSDQSSRNGWNVQGQFSGYSRHAITGVTPDGLTGAKIECTNCHNAMVSQRGSLGSDFAVRVIDPFNVFNLWQDNTRGVTPTFTNFCLNCHGSGPWPETTTSPSILVPYTIAFPNVSSLPFFSGWDKTAFLTNPAGHSINYTCQNCHHPHGSDNPRLNAYFDGTVYDTSNAGALEENLCFQCHKLAGALGAPDIKTIFDTKTYTHPTTSYALRHSDTETGSDLSNRHAECVDCHNPHEATSGNHIEGEPFIGGSQRGVGGVTPINYAIETTSTAIFVTGSPTVTGSGTNWFTSLQVGWYIKNNYDRNGRWYRITAVNSNVSITITPNYNGGQTRAGALGNAVDYTAAKVDYTTTMPATYQYEICLKCHTTFSYGDTPPNVPSNHANGSVEPETDVGLDFNTNHLAIHPVTGLGKHQTGRADQTEMNAAANNWPLYTAGTIDVTNGSVDIVGTGTNWLNMGGSGTTTIMPGWLIKIGADVTGGPFNTGWYQVDTVGSNATMTITTSYGGTTGTGNTYKLGAGFGNNFNPPWGPWARLVCSDCHKSDSPTDPEGPHGSAARWVLRKLDLTISYNWWDGSNVVTVTPNSGAGPDTFCHNCHRRDVYGDYDPLNGGGYYNPPRAASARINHPPDSGGGGRSLQTNFVNNWGVVCMNCHGGDSLGGLHGTSAKKGMLDPNDNYVAAGLGDTDRGVRFLNGATWIAVKKATVANPGACFTKNNADEVNNCSFGHNNQGGLNANYDY